MYEVLFESKVIQSLQVAVDLYICDIGETISNRPRNKLLSHDLKNENCLLNLGGL